MHNQILAEYPKDILEDHYRLSALVVELINRYNHDIVIHVIDPQSLPGIFKSLRYRISKYPAFIINNREIIAGWNPTALDQALESYYSQ